MRKTTKKKMIPLLILTVLQSKVYYWIVSKKAKKIISGWNFQKSGNFMEYNPFDFDKIRKQIFEWMMYSGKFVGLVR